MGELSYTVGGDSNLVSFKSAARVPITSLKAHFKPKQDLHGYSKPWPAGGGKNLYDVAHDTISNNTIINSSFEYVTNEYYATSGYVEILPSTEYTLSAALTNTFGAIFVCQCNENKEFIGERLLVYYTANKTVATFTTREDCKYIRFGGAKNNGSDSVYLLFNTFQLELGSTATSYEPYENICPIEWWNSANITRTGKNIAHIFKYSGTTLRKRTNAGNITNSYGTTLNTLSYTLPDTPLIITQTAPDKDYESTAIYGNGYFCIGLDNVIFGKRYDISFKITNILSNPLNKTLNQLYIAVPSGARSRASQIIGDTLLFKNILFIQNSNIPEEYDITIYNNGMSFTLSEFMVTEANTNDGVFEPYCEEVIPVTFPITGKNLFDPTNTVSGWVRAYNATEEKPLGSMNADNSWRTSDYVPVIENTTYTLTVPKYTAANSAGLVFFQNNTMESAISGISTFSQGDAIYTFTTPLNCHYIRFSWGAGEGDNAQLEYGSTATTYEPYSSNNTIYGGYIDPAAGEAVATYGIQEYDGTDENWQIGDSGNAFVVPAPNMLNTRTPPLCDRFLCNNPYGSATGFGVRISISNTPFTTKDEFKAELAINPIHVVYELNEPIHYPLSKSQLQTYLNSNAVWSNTNDVTEVSYAIHDTAPIRAAKERMIAFATKKEEEIRVPSAYRKLQYISAIDSNPYITTSITYPNELEAEVHLYNTKTEAFVFGARNDISKKPYCNLNISSDADKIRFDYGDYKYHVSTTGKTGEKIFKFHNRVATMIHVDTNTTRTYSYDTAVFTSYTSNPLLLFAVNTNGSPSLGVSQGELRMYSAKFWVGGKLVGNFLPCKRKSDDVIGMYDTITKQFYTSTNTDTFTAGPIA